MVRPIRRVVTGHDDMGRAVVVSDGLAPSVHINKAEQDWFSVDIWRTHDMPAKILPKAAEEPTAGPRRQMPTTNGTVLRINSFPPESDAVRMMTPADSLRVFEGLGNPKAATFGKGGRHPIEHPRVPAKVLEVRVGHAAFTAPSIQRPHNRDAAGTLDRQVAHHRGVQIDEGRVRHAHREGEGEHPARCEPPILGKGSPRKSQVRP